MRLQRSLVLVALGAVLWTPAGLAQEKAGVRLDVVKYDALKDIVAKQRGKVVLVDLWGEF